MRRQRKWPWIVLGVSMLGGVWLFAAAAKAAEYGNIVQASTALEFEKDIGPLVETEQPLVILVLDPGNARTVMAIDYVRSISAQFPGTTFVLLTPEIYAAKTAAEVRVDLEGSWGAIVAESSEGEMFTNAWNGDGVTDDQVRSDILQAARQASK